MLFLLLAKIRTLGTILESLPYINTVLDKVKQLIKFTPHLGASIMFMAMAMFLVLKSPNMHSKWLRHTVGSKVYQVMGKGYGGTGFAIKAPSGTSYILTNDHICASHYADGHMDITDNNGNEIPRRILERSENTDLCIIEGLPGVVGLTLGDEPTIGSEYIALGHADLRPLAITKGEITGHEDIKTDGREMKNGLNDPGDRCDKAKNNIVHSTIPASGVTDVYTCYNTTRDAYTSSIPIFYGSSGSPVVNFWGNVVGVVFAMNKSLHWADIVNHDDIKFFIRNY